MCILELIVVYDPVHFFLLSAILIWGFFMCSRASIAFNYFPMLEQPVLFTLKNCSCTFYCALPAEINHGEEVYSE